MFIQEPRHNKIINKLAVLTDIYRREGVRAVNDVFLHLFGCYPFRERNIARDFN